LRNALITASCITIGNIPEKSLTQARQHNRSQHINNGNRLSTPEKTADNQTQTTTAKRFSVRP
jgi:hypothetical protein